MQAENIREGMMLLMDRIYQEVIYVNLHKGSATTGMMVHLKLRNMQTGAMSEPRLAPDEKVEEVPVTIKPLQYLYMQGESVTFMDPTTYEQITLDKRAMGPAAGYLTEDTPIPVLFHDEKPLAVRFPKVIEMTVASTGAGFRGQGHSTDKPATLTNGIEILVPQFIETGDRIKVEVETNRYVERVRGKTTFKL